MKYIFIIALLIINGVVFSQKAIVDSTINIKFKAEKISIALHGGAGTILKQNMTAQKEKEYQEALGKALQLGYDTLEKGSTALTAVSVVVQFLEDSPLFNAGKGAVFTADGKNELDAAIMDGSNLKAGSIAGVTTIKNPILGAIAVMNKSPHVMLTGKGAELFAQQQGLKIVPPSYFYTQDRWKGLQKAKQKDSAAKKTNAALTTNHDEKFGTVGCVVRDGYGNLAAGTSTGGMTNKKYNRVGDAPIIGAGTYANNATCAISCTGWGEYFIRLVMAKTISDIMEYGNQSLEAACQLMVNKKLPELGGDGGLIAVDKDGNISMPFCTAGMYRASRKYNTPAIVKIYKD
jgi:L-asparaginase / beta-aspartyl-peptidase